MKSTLSLKNLWVLIILAAVIIPTTTTLFWFGHKTYTDKLNSILQARRQANDVVRDQIQAEVKRLKSVFHNKIDPLIPLTDKLHLPGAAQEINRYLGLIIEREPAVHEIMVVFKETDAIVAISPDIGITESGLLPAEQSQKIKRHIGLANTNESPEIIIPLSGRDYVGSPKKHNDGMVFSIAVPIGDPAKAVMIATINTHHLLTQTGSAVYDINSDITQSYLLGQGRLMTTIADSDYHIGDLMTHLAIVHSTLRNQSWPTGKTYIGINNKPVFGTATMAPVLGWILVSEVLSSEITQPIWKALINIAAVVILGLIFFIGVILFWAKKTMQPIQELCDATYQVAQGDFQLVLQPSGVRELNAMVTGFNAMVKARKNAELRILEREQNLAVTLNSIGDAVITTDAQGNISRMNPVAEQLSGWTLQEAKGKRAEVVFHVSHTITGKPIKNLIKKALSVDKTLYLSNHTTLSAKDGTKYQISYSASPIRNQDKNTLGIVLVFNDITEQYQLRKKETSIHQRLKDLFNALQTMVAIFDVDGTVTFVNNTPLNIAGIEANKMLGEKIWDTALFNYSPKMQALVRSDISRARGGESTLRNIQIWTSTNLLWVELNIHPVFDANGQVIQLVAEGRDISKRLEQEEQLSRAQRMDALGKLTGGIAHDYNNILGVVLGYSYLLKNKLKGQTMLASYAEQIHNVGERGAKLTKKLLAFSRKETTQAVELNINTVLHEQQDVLQKTLTLRIKLIFDLADELWPVWLDRSELEDVIFNISINAMHAMADIKSNAQLTISTQNQSLSAIEAQTLGLEAKDYVQIVITDNGCGMDKKTKEKIFDPFFSTKGDRGTGLGLSQVFGFVNRAHGTIKVYSEPGSGSQFALYFPRYTGNAIASNTEFIVDDHALTGNETILIVDDEPALRELATELLSQQGYSIICAANGKQALERLAHKQVDLMLSDVIMPEMDGYQLAAIVQEKFPTTKIQLISGFTDEHHKMMDTQPLHQNLLQKPYDAKTLFKKIRSLLDDKTATAFKCDKKTFPLLIWTDDFNTGIPEIDKDHKEMLLLLNRCVEATNTADQDQDQDQNLNGLFKDLESYTQTHFQREEAIMEACNHPQRHKHEKVHQLLLKEFQQQQLQFDRGEISIYSLLEFISDWLTEHLSIMDRSIANSFKKINKNDRPL